MPYRKEQFANGEIYHIVLRAIDDNVLFKGDDDHYRMIFSIYEFNNAKPVEILERRKERARFKKALKLATGTPDVPQFAGHRVSLALVLQEEDRREKLVEVLCFKLMPNHIHLLVMQLKDGGISKFMQKLGVGYAKYFNEKYQRKGHLFQEVFRSVHIEDEEQLKTVFVYIHTNGISIIEPSWKENGIQNPERVIEFLENYKWSSYQDYLGKKNFRSVTQRDFLLEIMGGPKGCKEFVDNWIRYKAELKDLPEVSLG